VPPRDSAKRPRSRSPHHDGAEQEEKTCRVSRGGLVSTPSPGQRTVTAFSSFHLKLFFILFPLAKEMQQKTELLEQGNESWPRRTWGDKVHSGIPSSSTTYSAGENTNSQLNCSCYPSQERNQRRLVKTSPPYKVSVFPVRGDPNNHPAPQHRSSHQSPSSTNP